MHTEIFPSLLVIPDTLLAMLPIGCSTIIGQSNLVNKKGKEFWITCSQKLFFKIVSYYCVHSGG